VKLANSLGYRLSASVFTRDLRKAFALAKKLESGYGSGTLIKKNLLTHPKTGPYQLYDGEWRGRCALWMC
jgi:hypothetical protein